MTDRGTRLTTKRPSKLSEANVHGSVTDQTTEYTESSCSSNTPTTPSCIGCDALQDDVTCVERHCGKKTDELLLNAPVTSVAIFCVDDVVVVRICQMSEWFRRDGGEAGEDDATVAA